MYLKAHCGVSPRPVVSESHRTADETEQFLGAGPGIPRPAPGTPGPRELRVRPRGTWDWASDFPRTGPRGPRGRSQHHLDQSRGPRDRPRDPKNSPKKLSHFAHLDVPAWVVRLCVSPPPSLAVALPSPSPPPLAPAPPTHPRDRWWGGWVGRGAVRIHKAEVRLGGAGTLISRVICSGEIG
jgi:hypothetical protein